MLTGTDDQAFKRRLITSVSFSMNPEKLTKGKERIMELIYEIADILSEGACTEIYQLNVQLYPLTNEIKEEAESYDAPLLPKQQTGKST